MKKSIAIVLISLVLSLAIFFATQIVFGHTRDTGELQVTSQPEVKVYLDDQYLGTTPICRCAGKNGNNVLLAKDYTLKLVPQSGDLTPFYQHISIAKGVLTVVDRTFAAPGASSGSVLQLEALADQNASELVVTTFPADVDILLDENKIGVSPYSMDNPTESDHVLTLQKTGFQTKTIHIRTPKRYRLHVIGYLAVDPNATISLEGQLQASSSADLSPSPTTPVVAKVTILDTPTGFLRVRAEANLGSAEIGEVKPGDSLFLIDEQPDWYQVKLPDNKIGWISSQYAQKE